MSTLSSTAWVIHDVALAANIGGGLFGTVALEPALKEISSDTERDRVSERAWNRYGWIKLASHVGFALPWFIGRAILSGREVSPRARSLSVVKDVLVVASLATGVASFSIGRFLARKVNQGSGPERTKNGQAPSSEAGVSTSAEKAVSAIGTANLIATTGVMAVTALLAMEASESHRFSVRSKRLP